MLSEFLVLASVEDVVFFLLRTYVNSQQVWEPITCCMSIVHFFRERNLLLIAKGVMPFKT